MTYDSQVRSESLEVPYPSLFEALPGSCILLKCDAPRYTILATTPEYLVQTGTTKECLIGKGMFEAFPTNFDDPIDTGTNDVRASFEHVRLQKEPHQLPVQRYDIIAEGGNFTERYWRAINKPVFSPNGEVAYIIHTAEDITDQVKAVEREKQMKVIEESEQRFRLMANSIPEIVWATDTEGKTEFINKRWEEYSGTPFTPTTAAEVTAVAVHPDDAPRLMTAFKTSLKTGKPLEVEQRNRSASGDYRWFLNRAKPYFDPQTGNIQKWFGISIDIHERKMAQQALVESERRFRLMADASPVMIWTLDAEGNSTYYNKTATEFTGHTEEELKDGRTWQTAIHPDDIDYASQVVRSAVQNRQPYQMECRMRRADGEWRWLLSHGMPRLGEKDELLGYVGSSVDITDRKVAEEALLYRKALLEAQNNAIPDAILIVDTKGTMISYNHQFAALWDIPQAIIDAKDDAAALDFAMTQVADPQAFIDRVAYCYAHPDEPAHEEIPFADGRMIERYGNAVIGDDGTNYGWVWYFRDITHQKQLTQRLEKLVVERTKALQQSNDNLQQFAHVASHDLKEPVRKIKTFTGRLEAELQDVLNEKSKLYLDKVQRATERMFLMIDGVLTYSTIDASKQAVQMVDLNEVIKNIEIDLEVLTQQTDTRIFYMNLPSIEGSSVLLYQLFYNLMNNAIKFAKTGIHPIISIGSAIIDKEDQQFAQILFNDNGIGFEQEQAEKIFETFTRLHSKDKYEGTGLGLSLCKKIVERHGGSIQAKSRLEEGATFIILLPLKQTSLGI
jgi:hypothetical protein